ncbi:MAG: EmrB/QacA family drug resistance transporter, partial [Nostocaceae cyanobacterium]|nr:EmrB/QacA family drug resistance transporter [Nostocaceae cyanobacterium]
LTTESGIDQLKWAQLVRAMGQPLIFVPLTTMATADIEREQAGSASGLFNMMRNLGGSMGIAALGTLLTRREQLHSNRLGEAVSLYNPATQQAIEQKTQFFISHGADPTTAQNQAFQAINQSISQQAYIMAYNDCFYFIGIALLVSGLAIIFFKKVKATGGAAAH